MDGHLMNQKVSNLSHISEERWKKLLEYFENNSLSLAEKCSLLNEITLHKDIEQEQNSSD
tara:strand:- start:306 stop:485 length:180 start_codon:yes stop_codon:yes gene_type:complete